MPSGPATMEWAMREPPGRQTTCPVRSSCDSSVAPPGTAPDPVEPGLLRSGGPCKKLVAVLVERQVVEHRDVRRPCSRGRELELPGRRLDVPRIVVAPLDPESAEA